MFVFFRIVLDSNFFRRRFPNRSSMVGMVRKFIKGPLVEKQLIKFIEFEDLENKKNCVKLDKPNLTDSKPVLSSLASSLGTPKV